MTPNKMVVEIELEFNGILFKEDVKFEVEEWLNGLKFRHLTNKKVGKITRT